MNILNSSNLLYKKISFYFFWILSMLYTMEKETIFNTDVASVIETIFADYPKVITTFFKYLEKINNVAQYAALKKEIMLFNSKLWELSEEIEKKLVNDILSFDKFTMGWQKMQELRALEKEELWEESIEHILDSI